MRVPSIFAPFAILAVCLSLAACGGSSSTTPPPDEPDPVITASFVHQALPANTLGSVTTIDHAMTNDDPNAILIVTPVLIPADLVYVNHALNVRYLGARWVIEYADVAAIPAAASFHVTVSTTATAGNSTFAMHTTAPGNIQVNRTFIDHPATNSNPGAVILLTQNAGTVGPSHDHAVGLVYDTASSRWAIFNRDSALMATGVAFNFAVAGTDAASPFSVAMYDVSTGASIFGGATYPGLGAGPAAITHATHVFEAGGAPFPAHHGVIYDGTRDWGLLRQDAVPVVADVGCNFVAARP